MKRTWTQEPTDGRTYYIVQKYRGSVYGIYTSQEDAHNSVENLKKYSNGREIIVIEAKDILHLKEDTQCH